jgi:hypothetical protein
MKTQLKDLLITDGKKDNVRITAQTEKALKVFKSQGAVDVVEGKKKHMAKLLAWAISHDLSFDSKVPLTIPERPRLEGRDVIKKALCMPNSVPESFMPRTLFAVGTSKFKGDTFGKSEQTKKWSVNDKFDKGIEYPVYDHEGLFVVGKDGVGYKMTPIAWGAIEYF